jgi:hypothetical protein
MELYPSCSKQFNSTSVMNAGPKLRSSLVFLYCKHTQSNSYATPLCQMLERENYVLGDRGSILGRNGDFFWTGRSGF